MRKFNTIGQTEVEGVRDFITNDVVNLSGYVGTKPYGGPQCLALEGEWAIKFRAKYAVAVNSATSGLLAACMACGIGVGDEVIVSAYTMSASAAAPKLLGAGIVFADIEQDSFGLDVDEVANAITPKTKAVIVTSLFGNPARVYDLKRLCDEHGIYLIEDNAQSIFAKDGDKYTGTVGHIGVFSLNIHKQLQTGEGGICTTNSPELARKLREAMNHGEMRGGILGLNLRMTEITAVLVRAQLRKGLDIVKSRREMGEMITRYVKHFKLPLTVPHIRDNCEHSYYVWAGLLTKEKGDGVLPEPWRYGYVHPLYSLPALSQNIVLPVVEEVERKIVICELCSFDAEQEEIAQMVQDLGKAL